MCDKQNVRQQPLTKLPAISDSTYVQRLGNCIDDEGMAHTPDDEDARIKDAQAVCREGARCMRLLY